MHFGRHEVFAWRRTVGQVCDGDVMRMFALAGIMCFILTAALLTNACQRIFTLLPFDRVMETD